MGTRPHHGNRPVHPSHTQRGGKLLRTASGYRIHRSCPAGEAPTTQKTRAFAQEWRASADNVIPYWFGVIPPARMAEFRIIIPAPLPKPPLAPLIGHGLETDYNPLFPTSSSTTAVGPVPPVASCPELTQRAFEAFRYHKSHD